MRRLIEDGCVDGKNFIQVGLRGYAPWEDDVQWMRDHGIRSHYMAEVERDGFDKVMERAIAEALDGPEVIFISYDIDPLDPAYAPGTSIPEPGGFTTRDIFPMVRRDASGCYGVGGSSSRMGSWLYDSAQWFTYHSRGHYRHGDP